MCVIHSHQVCQPHVNIHELLGWRIGMASWPQMRPGNFGFCPGPSHKDPFSEVALLEAENHWRQKMGNDGNQMVMIIHWLVVWNMTFIFHSVGNGHPNWLIFFRGNETTKQIHYRYHWIDSVEFMDIYHKYITSISLAIRLSHIISHDYIIIISPTMTKIIKSQASSTIPWYCSYHYHPFISYFIMILHRMIWMDIDGWYHSSIIITNQWIWFNMIQL